MKLPNYATRVNRPGGAGRFAGATSSFITVRLAGMGKWKTGAQLSVTPDHHDHKTPRLGRRTTGGSRLLFLEFERRQIRFVSRKVNVHGFGAKSGGHRLHDLELARRIFSYNRSSCHRGSSRMPVDRRTSWHLGRPRSEDRRHLAVVRAHHNHLLRLAASYEEPVLRDIDR